MEPTKNTTTPDLDINAIVLKNGSHRRREQGVCLMEAVAWMAGEKHSDRPQCADPVLAAYGRALNDRLRDDERQLLRPLIPKLIGTRGSSDLSRRRAFVIVDRYLRQDIAAFFRELPNKPRPDLAERFEALGPVVDGTSAERARDLAREVRADITKSWSAADAAYDAAYAAAYAAYAYAAADAAYAYAVDDAAYAYAAADAAYAYAVDDAAYAYAVDAAAAAAAAAADAAYDAAYDAADADAADAADKALRERTIQRAIATFEAALALAEAP
jgi:hypothetical protein